MRPPETWLALVCVQQAARVAVTIWRAWCVQGVARSRGKEGMWGWKRSKGFGHTWCHKCLERMPLGNVAASEVESDLCRDVGTPSAMMFT